ncbi:hypothetical protein BJV82DRAFT_656291 [Fennellomyces sp. T-0311]|nr:hypothetical protein BJV82DRAFT_656291 [Fennellomyces sp. T-0311]
MPRKQGKEPGSSKNECDHTDALNEISSSISSLASTLDIIKKDLGYLKEVVKVTNDKTKQLAQSLNHYEKDTAPAMYDGTMERRIGHPTYKAFDKKLGKEVDRTRQWSIELFVWLIQEYRKVEKLPALPLSRILALARHGTILHVSIIARFKIKKKLDNSVPWSDLRVKPYHRNLFEKLEKEVNPYIPLGSCVRFWGARIILQKHWSNVQQSDYQKTDNHSGDDDDLQENNQESIDSTSTCSITGDGESSSESYSACTSNEEWDDEEESSTNEDGEDYDEDNETDASHSAQVKTTNKCVVSSKIYKVLLQISGLCISKNLHQDKFAEDILEIKISKRILEISRYMALYVFILSFYPVGQLDVTTMTVDGRIFDYNDYSSFIEFFQAQVARYHDKICIQFQSPGSSELRFTAVTYGQFDRITSYLVREWSSKLEGVQCVGVLSDDCVQSLIAMAAILKLGRIFFPISTGNSKAAITQLLIGTNTQYLFASEQYTDIARTCASRSSVAHVNIWESFDVEHLITLSTRSDSSTYSNYRSGSKNLSDVVLMIQSSGSTRLPKPLCLSNQWLVREVQIFAQKEGTCSVDPSIQSNDTLILTSAVYRAFGQLSYWTPLSVGAKVFMFRSRPPIVPDLLSVAAKSNATVMISSPIYLENTAKYLQADGNNEAITAVLKQFKLCLYSGASLGLHVGNLLHLRGLNVQCAYGSTVSNYHLWEPFGDGLYHLLIRGDYPSLFTNVIENVGPGGYFATGYLFQEEPPKSGYWRYARRINDTLVLSDGGKTDPILLENEIRSSSLIKRCLVFGHSRSHTGVLIELNMEQAVKYQQSELLTKVYEVVKAANDAAAQGHSIIAVPEMVYILPPNRSLSTTSKTPLHENSVIYACKIIDCVLLNVSIYCYGGALRDHDADIPREALRTNYFIRLDLIENRTVNEMQSMWETPSGGSVGPNYHFAMAALPKLNSFLIDGGRGEGHLSNQAEHTVSLYNANGTGTWPTINATARPNRIESHVAITGENNVIYIQGGRLSSVYDDSVTGPMTYPDRMTTFTYLSASTQIWDQPSDILQSRSPQRRVHHKGAFGPDQRTIYFIGGIYEADAVGNSSVYGYAPMNEILAYDTSSGTWTNRMTSGVTPQRRMDHTVTMKPSTGELIVYGGTEMSSGTPLADYLYTLDTSTWQYRSVTPISSREAPGAGPRFGHAAVLIGNSSLFIIFGSDIDIQNDFHVLDIDDNFTWKSSVSSLIGLPENSPSDDHNGDDQTSSAGLSTGALVGIIVGLIAAVAIIIGAIIFILLRKRRIRTPGVDPLYVRF